MMAATHRPERLKMEGRTMALTWREISLPTRTESWRVLRGLRAAPPGAAADDSDRSTTFQTALEQAQQFMEAAERAGHATRPVQLFYALSQAGRAIAAAATKLCDDTNRPESRWRLSGHGIKTLTNASRVAEVTVEAQANGALPSVSHALGAECLPVRKRVKLSDLWALLPESFDAPLEAEPRFPALSFNSSSPPRKTSIGYDKADLGYVPTSVRAECLDNPERLGEFFSRYPSLNGWSYPSGAGMPPLNWRVSDSNPNSSTLPIYWPYPEEGTPEFEIPIAALKSTAYLTSNDRWVFPSLDGMTERLHPLITWWAILHALSTLARYEPSNWNFVTNIDQCSDANAIESILDKALDALPALVLQGIESSSRF